MKKAFYLILFLAVAAAGFHFGRSSGLGRSPLESVVAADRSYPLPPPPPESQPYALISEAAAAEDISPVVLESPAEGAEIRGSFEVSGRAKSALGTLMVAVTDADGQELFSRKVVPSAEGGAEFGRFSASVGDLGRSGEVTVRVTADAVEGVMAERRVNLKSARTVEAQVFFSNTGMDPWQSCEKAFPVKREIASDGTVYRSALEALFAGPTDDEKKAGYSTALPDGVKLKSVAADSEGIVTADFTQRLEFGVTGSCRVATIRAQVEETLKQFPEVRGVVIAVDGVKDGVLMP